MSSIKLMRLYRVMAVIMFSGMSIITFVLVQEYCYFKQQAEELTVLKEEYDGHVVALKRLLLEAEQSQDEAEQEDEKKKTLQEDPF